MYMNKREKKILAAGIAAGAVVMCVIFMLIFLLKGSGRENDKSEEAPKPSESVSSTDQTVPAETAPSNETITPTETTPSTEATSPTDTPEPTTPSESATAKPTGRSEWKADAVYVGGDEVTYNGRLYRAKWWTTGEKPGSADVWEDLKVSAEETETKQPATTKPTTQKEPESSVQQKPGERSGAKVVAYYPSWRSDQSKLRYDIITHVVYAFAIPTAEGGLRALEGAEQVPALIQKAHSSNAKVLLGVGGWSYNDVPLENTFMTATSTPERTEAFVDAIVAMCEKYGFDGVDMDWEHPRVDGASAKQYERLMLSLAEKLHSKGKVLTSAVLSGVTADGLVYYDAAAHSDSVLEAVDWIHVMAYDGGDGERHLR